MIITILRLFYLKQSTKEDKLIQLLTFLNDHFINHQTSLVSIRYSQMLILLQSLNIMFKDKLKERENHLFTFTNSVKNSTKATPETSKYILSYISNVSFQNIINASMKSFHTEPYSLLKQSNYPHLFSSNKENDDWRLMNSCTLKNESTKYLTNQHQRSTSKKSLTKNINSKSKTKLKSPGKSSGFNIKIDLTSSLPSQQERQSALKNNYQSSKKERLSTMREENIKVFIRLKPKSSKEQSGRQVLHILNDKTIKIEDNYFSFDQIFEQSTNQQRIFKEIGMQMCQKLFEGYNGTIFAYGQTGSGKTYTIFGQETIETHGLIYRCIREILQHKQSLESNDTKVKCSMVQLYKEQLIDMFGSGTNLKLKEVKNGGVCIEGLKQVYIKNETEMMNLVRNAAKHRKVTATKLNEESSRSHTILSIYLESPRYTTKLCLIDLAGSEKVTKSGTKGQAFQETKKINYSLSCLGNVINALTTRNKADHIPFRDSKLTRILKDSLTGNFITSMIVNCSTAEQSVHETISSLKFAERAKKIKVNVQSLEEEIVEKESIEQLHSIIKKLQNDLEITTNELKRYQKKESQSTQKSKIQPQRLSANKKQPSACPPLMISNVDPQPFRKKTEEDQCNYTCESDLTARYPIPSQRAGVDQNIKRYKNDKGPVKQQPFINSININEFSSLNVSKSIKKFGEHSPDISSLSFNYDECPDLSLSFSIQGDSAQRQLLFNSPL